MNSTMEQPRPRAVNSIPPTEWTDENLLLRYQEHGDGWAFEELVHRYERELYIYLRNYLGDAQMAEDTFQTTFLQVHLKCDQFDATRKVRPWLYTVATNQAIDSQRRNRRHRMVSLDRRAGGDGEDDLGALVQLLESREIGPVGQLETAEHSHTIRQAIQQLPDPLKDVVLLVYYQGLMYREAAEVLSIPVGTVKSRLHTAIYRLNQALTSTHLPGNG